MRSKNIFQLFESTLNKTGAYFSSNAPLAMPNYKLQKFGTHNLPTTYSGLDELSVNTSADTSLDETQIDLKGVRARTILEPETDFSYIKTDYTV